MNKKLIAIIVSVVVVFAILIAWIVGTRNSFVKLDENLNERWAQVEVAYQRRLDLIPNLVNTVKGYAEHESSTFEKVTQARAGLTEAYNNANAQRSAGNNTTDEASLENFAKSQQGLGKALSIYVNAVKEAYPTLVAGDQFIDLQKQLEGTENRIATERHKYAEAVKEYNLKVRTFPASIVASMSGFAVKPQFKADAEAASAPKVSF